MDSVEVKCEETKERSGASDEGHRAWQFPCGQWLEVCEGCGGKLEVELEVRGQPDAKNTSDKEKGTCTQTISDTERVHVVQGAMIRVY